MCLDYPNAETDRQSRDIFLTGFTTKLRFFGLKLMKTIQTSARLPSFVRHGQFTGSASIIFRIIVTDMSWPAVCRFDSYSWYKACSLSYLRVSRQKIA